MSSATKFIDPIIHDIHSVHDSSIAENALCENRIDEIRAGEIRIAGEMPLIQVVSDEKSCVEENLGRLDNVGMMMTMMKMMAYR